MRELRPPRPLPAERLVARASGLVQGVGFRYATVREAYRIGGLTGRVRNASDGSVEVAAEGAPGRLDLLEAWLRHGPPGAVVRDLDARRAPATGEWSSFDVGY